jgi:tRNA (uracil-5-)-methyltransferase
MTPTDFSTASYQTQLSAKLAKIQQDFADFSLPEITVFASPEKHYRMRAEFRVWHQQERTEYVMFTQDEFKRPYPINEFPVGSALMNQLMPSLLAEINSDELLRHKLYQVDFLTTQSGEALVTLIYHKALNDEWLARAKTLKTQLGIDIVGRSRKQRLLIERDHVIERLRVAGRAYSYQQVEASFTQPNARGDANVGGREQQKLGRGFVRTLLWKRQFYPATRAKFFQGIGDRGFENLSGVSTI